MAKVKRASGSRVRSVERRVSAALRKWMAQNPGKPISAFEQCVESVAKRGGAYSPRGVCAAAGRKKYGKKKFQQMAAAGRRKKKHRNPADQAAAVFEEFHGTPATKELVYNVRQHVHTKLADLGKLLVLVINIPRVGKFKLEPRGVRATTSEEKEKDRRQIYFIGGDQELRPEMFPGFHEPWKDHIDLGFLTNINYFTSKDFHDFAPTDYRHKFGVFGEKERELGMKRRPTLPSFHYDTKSKLFYISGGGYTVEYAGIVG